MLRTKAESSALFDLLGGVGDPAILALQDNAGNTTAAGRAVEEYLEASAGKDEFFDRAMYFVEITGWPPDKMQPQEPVHSSGDARLTIRLTDPAGERAVPPADPASALFATGAFSLMNSGNRTLRAPKRSWRSTSRRLATTLAWSA